MFDIKRSMMAKYCGVNPFQETISVCDIAMYKLIFLQKKNRNGKIASNRKK